MVVTANPEFPARQDTLAAKFQMPDSQFYVTSAYLDD